MKKSYILLFASALALTVASCNSDDPNKATSKHVYGEGEDPYLKSNPAATNSMAMDFQLSIIDQPQYINLKDYAPSFHNNLNMTVDETMAALHNGEVGFYTINTSRQKWNVVEPNYGEYGFYFNQGGMCSAENAAFTLSLDPNSEAIEIKAVGTPAVGTLVNFDFGFPVINGENFDDYVRFTVSTAVKDMGKVITSVTLNGGNGYEYVAIPYDEFAEDIEFSMQMGIDEFCELVDDPSVIAMLMEDANGNWLWDYFEMSHNGSTNGAQGYWLDADYLPCYWDGAGWPNNTFNIESYGMGDRAVYPMLSSTGAPAGSYTLRWVYVMIDDESRNVEFIVTLNVN